MIRDFIALIYPRLCASCDRALNKQETCICTICRFELPKTNYHKDDKNPVAKLFWGRAPVHSATGFYHFTKGGKVQRLMHELKYKGNQQVGFEVGQMMGHDLKEAPLFESVETIIPVPLHKKRLRKRGYNQAQPIADGLALAMENEVDSDTLYRSVANTTQTKKGVFDRWKNVESIFRLRNEAKLAGKHVLLVDDVVTTGSTLESCVHTLAQIPEIKVSVATLAVAR